MTYFFGLDSLQIPKNGDEFPYAHITRLTAESGHLLPLQSLLENMRNTKPPMLFWQGVMSTHWGHEWTLWHLRYPNVLYTLATAILVGLSPWLEAPTIVGAIVVFRLYYYIVPLFVAGMMVSAWALRVSHGVTA